MHIEYLKLKKELLKFKGLRSNNLHLYSVIKKYKKKKKKILINSIIKKIDIPINIKSRNFLNFIYNFILYKYKRNKFDNIVFKYLKTIESQRNIFNKKLFMESIHEESRLLNINDKVQRIYYLSDLPNQVNIGSVFKLINIGIPINFSYHIQGTNKFAMIKASKQRISVLESMQNERDKKGKSNDVEIDKEISEVSRFLTDLIEEREKSFLVAIYATITANSKEELMEYDLKFQEVLKEIEFSFNTYSFGQMPLLSSTFPFAEDNIKKELILQTSALTNILPFLVKNFNDPEGIFIGTNHFNNSLILFDFFKSRNANLNIFGTSGSGKSYISKLIISRLNIKGVQCIVLDPEGEYIEFAKKLQGEVLHFSNEFGINPFYLEFKDKKSTTEHIGMLKTFFKFFITENNYNASKLDKILTKIYDHETPNFNTFLNECKNEKFYEDIEQLQTGSLSGVFNSNNSILVNKNLIVFDLSDLRSDDKKIPAMFLLGNLINNLIQKDKKKKKMVFIDEAHKLLINNDTTNFYIDLVKTARKRNTGVVSITQNTEDFKLNNNSKTIITQAETSLLLKQSYSSVKYIKDNSIFPLTRNEEIELPLFEVGQALLLREKEHIYIDIKSFPKEHTFIST